MEPCTQSGKISELDTKVDRLIKIIDDNGQPGLYSTVIKLVENSTIINEAVNKLSNQMQTMIDYKTKTEAEEEAITALRKERDYHRKQKQWIIGVSVPFILFGLGILIKFILPGI